jgi:hypothetical protein
LLWATGGQMFQVIVESLMSPPRTSNLKAQMAKELQQTKEFIQQLLQQNYAMEYTMIQVIISTSVVC